MKKCKNCRKCKYHENRYKLYSKIFSLGIIIVMIIGVFNINNENVLNFELGFISFFLVGLVADIIRDLILGKDKNGKQN